jgi:outer membrane protein OmpA-like peptidoglycan-associated protein
MRKLVSLPLVLLGIAFSCARSVTASAQTIVALDEDFSDNQMEWWEGKADYGSARLEDGVYAMRGARPDVWWYASRPVYIDQRQDWAITATIRQTGGPSIGFGVIWGGLNSNNLNEMRVTSDGRVRVATFKAGSLTEHQPWKPVKAIHRMGEWNDLRIERRGAKMRYLVNGTEVAAGSVLPQHGLEVGIVVEGIVGVEIDHLLVDQKQKIRFVPNVPRKLEIVNLGRNINSEYEELTPVIAPDGKTLYFSVRHSPDNTGGRSDADEIWASSAIDDTTWAKRQHLGWPLNNESPNWVISVTPDNNTLLLANLYDRKGSYGGGGLSISYRSDTGWTVPERVVLRNLTNHSGWQQFGLSNDRKILLLSVTGDVTYGDHDLYVSFLQSDGTWSEQRNLGGVVNTIGAEASPFLAADGVTLSSNGRPGYGQGDIYVTRRLDETWTNWSEPENLGPAINTPGHEHYFTVPASGLHAYMNSTHNSLGKADIFRLRLPDALRPFPVVLVTGRVLRSSDKQPLAAAITYRDLASDAEVGIASSDPRDGSYKIVLPAGRVYSFMAELDGYYAVSDNLDVSKLSKYREIKRDLLLAPVEVGTTIRLNNLFFDFARSELRSESFPELNRAARFLKANPSVRVEIAGHTDDIGTDEDNQRLSVARARAVVSYLVRKGIEETRLDPRGYGESRPLAANHDDDGRQMNRRVEFRILER